MADCMRICSGKKESAEGNTNEHGENQGAAHGDPPRRDRRARQMACPSPAGLDGLLCCADERLSNLCIPASYDRTLARRPHAPQPAAPINVDPDEDDR